MILPARARLSRKNRRILNRHYKMLYRVNYEGRVTRRIMIATKFNRIQKLRYLCDPAKPERNETERLKIRQILTDIQLLQMQ